MKKHSRLLSLAVMLPSMALALWGCGDTSLLTALKTAEQAADLVAAPTFSPAAGSYSNAQTVTIGTTTPGASIRYTTNSSTPTSTTGTLYSTPVSVATSLMIKAIAYKTGWTDSTVAMAAYTIAGSPAQVNLGNAGNYEILAKTAVTNTGPSTITGDVGLSPAAKSFIAGLAITMDGSNVFATSSQVSGKLYAADMAVPTPVNLGTAILDMETAYTDAAGRPAGVGANLNLGAGILNGQTLVTGTYTWGTNVAISGNITISGGPNDVWIFQISGTLTVSSGINVILSGGAQAKNIFWQVTSGATLGTNSHFAGSILSQTAVMLQSGAVITGRALAQAAVTLSSATAMMP